MPYFLASSDPCGVWVDIWCIVGRYRSTSSWKTACFGAARFDFGSLSAAKGATGVPSHAALEYILAETSQVDRLYVGGWSSSVNRGRITCFGAAIWVLVLGSTAGAFSWYYHTNYKLVTTQGLYSSSPSSNFERMSHHWLTTSSQSDDSLIRHGKGHPTITSETLVAEHRAESTDDPEWRIAVRGQAWCRLYFAGQLHVIPIS